MAVHSEKKENTESKWDRRAKKFWMAFLFTKDGKPKSGYGVYTFFLSLLMVFIYAAAIIGAITLLNPILGGFAAWVENLIESLCSAVVGIAILTLLHYLFPDKNIMFGSYLWILAYLIAVTITMLIYLRGTGASLLFLEAFLWFALIPVVPGAVCSFLLFRRDYKPKTAPEEEPEYMKYIRRR